jgi:uncharacterized membrane protein
MLWIKLYFVGLVLFSVFDFIWLKLIAANLYQAQIGHLLAPEFRWGAAALFYLIYPMGVLFFCVHPVQTGINTLLHGALFGFFCYFAYDMTNLATLRGWPIKITIYDLLWGSFNTGVVSYFCFFTRSFLSR